MECTVIDRPIAEERDGDIICLQNLEAVTTSARLQNARADDSTRAHHSNLWRKQVHAAAASERDPGGSTEQLGDQLLRLQPFRQSMTVSAVRTEGDVIIIQVRTDARRDRFLADVRVTGTQYEASLVVSCELLFRLSDCLHRAIQRQGCVAAETLLDC